MRMSARESVAGAALPGARSSALPVHALWATGLVSMFGNQLTALAVPWFVLDTTGSASRTGIVAAVTVIPVVIAQVFGGALADRVSYRGLSVTADLFSAITVAAVPALHFTIGLSFPALLVLMFLGALLDAPGHTARTAMVPSLSRLTGISLERINANFGMLSAFAGLFSAPVAGLLIAWLGAVHVLWFNAATFVISAVAVLLCIPRLPRPAPTGETFLQDVRDGLAYLRHHRLLRTLIIGALLVNFLFAPLFGVAIPWFANQELGSARALGIMLGGNGLGALAGAFLFGQVGEKLPRRRMLQATLVLLTLPLAPFALVDGLWPAAALLVLVGLGSGLVNPMLGTFVQRTTPDHYMGRVMGMIGAGAMLAQPLGLLLGGSALALFGFTAFTLIIAVAMATIAIVLGLAPVLRQLDATPDTA
jgi:MFS family permease